MVCVACLLPLFLVPIVNVLPLLFFYVMGKVYALFGWEYKRPERAPVACPYKPAAQSSNTTKVGAEGEVNTGGSSAKPAGIVDSKED